ncbi:hypothetical protein N0B31_07825 [Salinirubellus salinus]|jgi:hypothetical protein|uniref:Uncharacterized protein n=1 Tax=Salinirubellus salinus TaxID=1364945 RepID=A0A9E7U9Q5_9EURY|nr:hypothetical protein [Salinirubellus salinus]UWM56191.1 hypothetical protein N0B31_07825 [Salinirubellus salinus]
MSSGVLVRQALARGESHRTASVLTRMEQVADVVTAFDHLTVGAPESAEFGPRGTEWRDPTGDSSTGRGSSEHSRPTED